MWDYNSTIDIKKNIDSIITQKKSTIKISDVESMMLWHAFCEKSVDRRFRVAQIPNVCNAKKESGNPRSGMTH